MERTAMSISIEQKMTVWIFKVSKYASHLTIYSLPSFPRRRESKLCWAINTISNIAQGWIPAYAGTTGVEKWRTERMAMSISREQKMTVWIFKVSKIYGHLTIYSHPSFPRRRESKLCWAITKFANIAQPWIPAYAGMTGFEKWWMKRMMAGISIEQKNDGQNFESVKNTQVI